jgi:hypothetical protein
MSNYFDPEDSDDIKQLHTAIDWSLEEMRDRRETRLLDYAQYVGPDFGGENCADDAVPINMIELCTNVLHRFITSHSPEVDISSDYRSLLPQSADITLACNQEAKRINLADALSTWTIEAMFAPVSVLEVGITTKDTPPDGEGYLFDPGHLFVDPILFDRLILDMTATTWDQQFYMGHEYSVPLDWVKSNPEFDQAARDKVTAPNPEEMDWDIASESLSHSPVNMETLLPMVTLRQIFIPTESLVLQFWAGNEESHPPMPLQKKKWTGPERGMYHWLGFGKVPGSLYCNAPVRQWAPLHDQLNSLWNKITDQGDRQKTLLLIKGHAAADGQRVVKATDGDAIYTEDPKACTEMTTGGANPQTFALALQCKETLDWLAGNISSLGGLAAQSQTLGQDKMLAENASGKPQDMQERTIAAEQGVYEDMAYWLCNDPISEYYLVKQIGNTDETIEFTWGPQERAMIGSLTRYNFTVDPFSRAHRSPSEKANAYLQYLLQVLIPGQQSMMQQGMDLDWEYIVKTISKFSNLPDVKRSIRYIQGEAYPERGPVDKPGMAPNTSRTNVRVNRSAPTQQGKAPC